MGRLERLERRRLDSSLLVKASMVHEVYKSIQASEPVRYAIGAMQPIDPEYTQNTFKQGDRVKSQLKERLEQDCDFRYQGSTDTDTHIRARSDVDLLVIYKDFEWLEPPQQPANPYRGDPKADITKLRKDSVSVITSAFPEATCNNGGSRAVKLSGASLSRDVDIVPASWYNTNDYARTREEVYRGVKVFDAKSGEFTANTPFLHKRRIQERDELTRGGLRRAIRLMKSLMYDSDGRVSMSSYNICGIAYNIAPDHLSVQRPRELAILEACHEYCQRLLNDTYARDRILVPDGHRTVFGGTDGASQAQLQALAKEIADLRSDIVRSGARAFQDVGLIEVKYPTGVVVG